MTGRMIETAKYYLEGETKGNMTQSMLKAGYRRGYALTNCEKVKRHKEFIEALDERKAFLEHKDKESRINIDKRFDERYNECIGKGENKRIDNANAIRCLENMAKNRGYYELDNKQKAEQRQLTEKEAEEARRIASIRLQETG